MKRSAVIIVVLIALMAIIGVDRISQGFRFLVSDDRLASSREARPALKSEGSPSESLSAHDPQASRDSSHTEHSDSSPNVTGATNEHSGSQVIAVSVTGERSPLHFIRASTIFGTSEPTKEQIIRLRDAVAVVGEGLRPSAVIFDADGLSTSQAPVILFVRDAFDLTVQVKSIYDAFPSRIKSQLPGR